MIVRLSLLIPSDTINCKLSKKNGLLMKLFNFFFKYRKNRYLAENVRFFAKSLMKGPGHAAALTCHEPCWPRVKKNMVKMKGPDWVAAGPGRGAVTKWKNSE